MTQRMVMRFMSSFSLQRRCAWHLQRHQFTNARDRRGDRDGEMRNRLLCGGARMHDIAERERVQRHFVCTSGH
jgi:hypothetical protein